MLQPRLPSRDTILSLTSSFNQLTCRVTVRHASHAAQGRANGPKDSAGRRLGAKKTATQYVIPGNIIYKQRGKQKQTQVGQKCIRIEHGRCTGIRN